MEGVEKIKAKIANLEKTYEWELDHRYNGDYWCGYADCLKELKNYIDILEGKEVYTEETHLF